MNVGSLFTGIGGFDLGFERAGMEVAWQVELDPFCRKVLAKHWPGVPCYEDVRDVTADGVEPVDLLCGGFPCTDLSSAGRREGLDGEQSSLWFEFARLIGELRPRYVVVENVADLLVRGRKWFVPPASRVLADLAACGYDAEWDCIPADAIGAHHERDRVWIVAYPQTDGCGQGGPGRPASSGARERQPVGALQATAEVADAAGTRLERAVRASASPGDRRRPAFSGGGYGAAWASEPSVVRVADGVPDRVDRTAALGNALVPQIAEWIGRRILEWEGMTNAG